MRQLLRLQHQCELHRCTIFDTLGKWKIPVMEVRFFKTDADLEPVRDCLKSLGASDKKAIGEDIKTVQFGWPLGMSLVDHDEGDIWEVRTRLDTRIVRVLFVMGGS